MTPDTLVEMLVGFSVIFIILFFYILSMVIRFRREQNRAKEHDLRRLNPRKH